VPNLGKLIHIFQENGVFIRSVPLGSGPGCDDSAVKVPDPESNEGGLCTEHNKRWIYRVKLCDGNPTSLGCCKVEEIRSGSGTKRDMPYSVSISPPVLEARMRNRCNSSSPSTK